MAGSMSVTARKSSAGSFRNECVVETRQRQQLGKIFTVTGATLRTAFIVALALGGAVASAAEPVADPAELARRIDRHLAERFTRERIIAAPAADDAEFLRRAYLDLTGRIPRTADVYEFLADSSKDKRAVLIDELVTDAC